MRYPLDAPADDKRYLHQQSELFAADQAETERILLPSYTPTERPGLNEGQRLLSYQKTAVDLTERVKNLLIVDDVGLGKSYEGLGIGLIEGALPLVIVVEPHLQAQWTEKAEEFVNLEVHSVKGTQPYNLPEADIYIFKYSNISGWVDVLSAGWVKAVVFDEVQQLRRGSESNKGHAAKSICEVTPIRVGLTATLIYNYGIEAFNIVEIFRPGCLGSLQDFMREWCEDDPRGKGVVKDPDALGTYLREQHMMLRRTKSDVGQEAKQLAPHLEWVEPNHKAVKDSEDVAKSLAMRALTGGFQEAGMAARELDMQMRAMTGVAKARSVAAYVRMLIESGQPVLLFGWHREVYRIWEQELGDLNPAWYTGSETPGQKERGKADFIEGRTDLMIMSLRSGAGADGIQHRCSTVVFGELDWSPQIHTQCIGRVDRDGQTDEVFVIYVVTNYGSDPVIIDVQGLKSTQNRGITDPNKKPENRQVDTDRLKRLARHYLESKGVEIPEKKEETENTTTLAEQVQLL